MQALLKPRLKSWLALLAVATVAVVVSATLSRVHAQIQDDEARTEATLTDYAEFQYATLTGTTNTINATMVPVVTATGTAYKNVTFQVTVSSTGVIAIVPGSPTVVASPVVAASSFKAGTYLGPKFGTSSSFNGMVITVSGPGVVAGGYTDWSLSAATTATSTCPYPVSATWYVGSPTSANNPLFARLKKAVITSTAYSYGTLGNASCSPDNGNWQSGSLIGVSQTGNAITIASFSFLGTENDNSTPQDQITFTLK